MDATDPERTWESVPPPKKKIPMHLKNLALELEAHMCHLTRSRAVRILNVVQNLHTSDVRVYPPSLRHSGNIDLSAHPGYKSPLNPPRDASHACSGPPPYKKTKWWITHRMKIFVFFKLYILISDNVITLIQFSLDLAP